MNTWNRRDAVRSRAGSLCAGWAWLALLLALSGCDQVFGIAGVPPAEPNVNPGPLPRISAIFCDIEKMSEPRRCAAQDDLNAVSLTQAATALNTRHSGTIALDYSPASRQAMGCGELPVVIPLEASFPEGTPICVNCFTIGAGGNYPDANALCVAECEDINGGAFSSNATTVVDFCRAHAHVSTNAPVDDCFVGACTPGGLPQPDFDSPEHPEFVDPRRIPERINWTDLIGTSPSLSSLTRTAASTGNFDAGAASTQLITHGDAYVEFEAGETNLSHVAGLSEIPAGCAGAPCPDTDAGLTDIAFAISLNNDQSHFYVIENGGATVLGPLGTYNPGDRFRVNVKDNGDGTAAITYSRITGACVPGTECAENAITAHTSVAHYPLRVDASFREQNARLLDVRVVRIK